MLAALAAAASKIVDLNLAGTGLDDTDLDVIGALPVATHLRLARNELTDEALAALASSPQLEYLNLYGNGGITDSSIEALADLIALREIFLWQTGVTDAAAARLRARRPDLSVHMGATGAPKHDGG